MSWNVSAKGKPVEVKESLVQSFATARSGTKHIPAEYSSVIQAEAIVNQLVDVLVQSDFPGVSVNAYGSGCVNDPEGRWKGNVSFNLSVTPLFSLEEPMASNTSVPGSTKIAD